MKFKFPLQKVLEHRKIKEDLAQKDFQEALNLLNSLQATLAQQEKALHESHERAYGLQRQGGAQGPALMQVQEFQRGQTILIRKQTEKIEKQNTVVEEKREILRQAAVETKVMDRLREKKFEEFRHEVNQQEQREADEQSVLRYQTPEKKESA